ncbi:hypothetical protein [Shewanella marina]|uniref:hypothetical protein n=1 Tax=Shewanella marina TaxID=487319 RepID=UPI000472A973|nr:hypothetical protein [Shewanella marina]
MKLIRFEFTCARQVPFYAHLCNQYLAYPDAEISIGYLHNCYFIEALGNQATLEFLADKIAQEFLVSSWLTDSKITLIEQRAGSTTPLQHGAVELEFCQQCHDHFADNQSANFGDINYHCDSCHGEQYQQGITFTDIQAWAKTLLDDGAVVFNLGALTYKFSRSALSFEHYQRQQVLICNPNRLNAHFAVYDHHVLALSSMEKPRLTVRPCIEHSELSLPLYDICFSYNRVITIFAELLRQRGVDYLYYCADQLPMHLTWIDGQWSELNQLQANTISHDIEADEPLHDSATISQRNASWKKGKIHFTESNQAGDVHPDYHAICAMHAGNIEAKQNKNSAVLYFNQASQGQIATLDKSKETELFFGLPSLPSNGYEIYHQLEQSPQQSVLEKYKARFADDYNALLDLKLSGNTNNLSSLFAVAAVILGLHHSDYPSNTDYLRDSLLACSMKNKGHNSQRIDFPLTRGEAHRSLNWCKTLGSMMSFRLASNEDISTKLAFGMFDSLADYLANWIEHLDGNIGVKNVVLAGDEFANDIFAHRLSLRLGKNYPLTVNRQLAIDSTNLCAGALYLKMRRR